MSLLGKHIRLKGLTQKAKNLIRYNGELWTVLAETDVVLFAPHEHGPFLFITPAGFDQTHKASRWVRESNDKDFELFAMVDLTG